MPRTEIYTKSWCPFCARAKEDLERLGIEFEEIDVTTDTRRELEMQRRAQRHTVPQIFVGGRHLGGSDDLRAAARNGELDDLIEYATAEELA